MKSKILLMLSLSAVTLGMIPFVGQPQAQAQPPVLTFSIRFEDKLFINAIPLASCNPTAVVGLRPAAIAAYMAFCKASDLAFRENPPTPNIVAPLDARIRGGADVQWQCQAGNPNPVNISGVAALATAGGPEPGGLTGAVNPTTTRDNILANGTFGYVVSGHPDPLAEVAFQVHRIRANTDIWDKVTGTITCGTDARGLPTSNVLTTLTYTTFPSHKLWYRTPMTAAAPTLLFNLAQGNFSILWFLPPVPAP